MIYDRDVAARDALSSFLNECCANDMFCFDLLNDHAIIPAHDSPNDHRDAVLAHLLNRKCVSTTCTPSCKLLPHDSLSTTHLSHRLCTLLLDAYQSNMIALNVFSSVADLLACMLLAPALDVN